MSICLLALLPDAAKYIARKKKVHAARHGYGSHSTQEHLIFLPGLIEFFYWTGTGPVCCNSDASRIGLQDRYTSKVPTMHVSATVLKYCGQIMACTWLATACNTTRSLTLALATVKMALWLSCTCMPKAFV